VCEFVKWIHLAKDWIYWLGVVSAVINSFVVRRAEMYLPNADQLLKE
jgi:hypothetical protein